MEPTIDAGAFLERLLRRWPWLAILGILGGAAGTLAARFRPPVYEAAAVLSVGLIFDVERPYSQYEEDLALGKAAGVAVSDQVLLNGPAAVGHGTAENPSPDLLELRSRLRLERKGPRWEFTAVHEDPQEAARLANAWVAAAEVALRDAFAHALRAAALKVELDALARELAAGYVRPPDERWTADQIERAELRLREITAAMEAELLPARGLTSFLSFEESEQALPPSKPIARGRGELALAGCGLGLLLGLVLTWAIPTRTGEVAGEE